jgi:uncharacterized membrane protein YfcA
VDPLEIVCLVTGGLLAGVVNTLAGGGSLLTVPLLVMLGLPGNLANGTNRVGILVQSVAALWQFRARGVSELGRTVPVLVPVVLGSLIGALGISQVTDRTFERLFGVLMLVLLIPTLRRRTPAPDSPPRRLSAPVNALLFFGVGLYGGAFQAGVGIPLVFALTHAGADLVRANAIKLAIVAVLTLVALPVFALGDQIAWGPGLVLAAGFAVGGALGAHATVRGGERLIRPVLAVAVIALAARLFGWL